MFNKEFFQGHIDSYGGSEGFLKAAKSDWEKSGVKDIDGLRAMLKQNPLTSQMNLSDEMLSEFLKKMGEMK